MAPAALAQALHTFVFTDIVGSTRLWERAPQAARQAVARHYDIIASCIAAYHGTIFKTVGDACCCAFDDPVDAVRAAVAVQRAMQAEEWPAEAGRLQVRVGIHSGEAIGDGGDYFGATLNRVARLMSAAHGGQILVSGPTVDSVRGQLQEECTFADLGAHRLKDLAQPQHLFQISADGLDAGFPPPLSLDAHPNNLPSQISAFVGRAEELRRLNEMLRSERLVTVCGVGGVGKTRLAMQAVADTIAAFSDGCWIARLADVTDPEFVVQSVASALQIAGVPGEAMDKTLVRELSGKSACILLDNAEHVLSAAAELARCLLTSCPRLTMLVTSREPLHVTGERVLRIGPLTGEDAQALFVNRANLELADAYIRHICKSLDGLPLAIELAAGRIGALTTRQLDARLNAILPMLASKDSSQEARHRTLEATIEWSFRLLNPKEQRFFALLSVFEGGFTLEACESVAWAGEEDDPAYALIDALVDKSFVAAEPAGDEMRYRLLEAMHGFARKKLLESGEVAIACDSHFDYYRAIAERWGTWNSPQEEQSYLRTLAVEMPNVRAALDYALSREDCLPAFEMLLKVGMYWQQHCSISEARSWLARACSAAADSKSIVHAKLLRRAATFATIEDDYAAARDLSLQARALFEELGDRPGTAEALHNLAVIEQRSGSEDEAYCLYSQALSIFEQTHHEIGTITALYNLAQTAKRRGDFEAAKASMERGMALCTSAQHADRLATFWTLRAEIAMHERSFDEAASALEQALEMKRALDDRHDQVEVLCNFAVLQIRRGDAQAAIAYAREALGLARDVNVPSLFIGCMEVFAVLYLRGGRESRAREILALARAIRAEHGYVYEIVHELRDDLAALADVAPATDRARDAVQRTVADMLEDYSL